VTMLSYIGAHWFLILSCIMLTIGLGAFAWFTKNWKAAVAAVVVVMAGLFYQSADLGGYKRALDEAKSAQIETLTNRVAVLSLLNAQDTYRAVADAKLNTQLETLASDTPPNAGPCLDAAAAHRVWAITGSGPGATPIPSRRVSNVLPWSLRRPRAGSDTR
jgi:signal transduction histidine kinase